MWDEGFHRFDTSVRKKPRRDMTLPLLTVPGVALIEFLTFELWVPHGFPH